MKRVIEALAFVVFASSAGAAGAASIVAVTPQGEVAQVRQVTVKFSDATFAQEGCGAVFPWNPADVTSIQIQSQEKNEMYDFWIDDIGFIK